MAQSVQWRALVEIENARPEVSGRPAASPVYRAAYAPDGPQDMGVPTLLDMFERSVRQYADRPCLGKRPIVDGVSQPFQYLTYTQVAAQVEQLASAYAALGLQPKDRIGVLGQNAQEWMMAMQAMNRMAMVCVPLYDTLGDAAVQYIVKHAGTRLVVASGQKLGVVAKALQGEGKGVADAGVVYWGKASPEVIKSLKDQGISVRSFEEMLQLGSEKPCQPTVRPVAEDLCTIMYTSGTTGDPKGVMISHRAVLSTISGIMQYLEHLKEKITCEDSFLSFLPLAHIMDRVLEELMLSVGGSIGYFQGDVRKLVDDIGALKPTLFVGVPRVFERIYNGVQDQIKKGGLVKSIMFQWAYGRKLYYMKQGWRQDKASIVSDLIVFNKIKQRLGGRVRVIVSGGAPLSPQIEQFLKVCMCTPVVQGYGLTETCAASFIAHPYNIEHLGSVGWPMPQTELRLEAVPEMGYSPETSPPSGEVLIRGPAVFSSYYKDEAMSRECIDEDGFFHTGDIGMLTADGSLKIIDRKKNIFKLSHGEYIAVERLEAAYKQCTLVEQIWVYGNSMESCLVAVVVPAEGPARAWGQQHHEQAPDLQALCANPGFSAYLLDQLSETARSQGLKGFEQVKALHLEHQQFSVDNGLMTPKFSLKRPALLKRYSAEVERMYHQLKGEATAGQQAKGARHGGSTHEEKPWHPAKSGNKG